MKFIKMQNAHTLSTELIKKYEFVIVSLRKVRAQGFVFAFALHLQHQAFLMFSQKGKYINSIQWISIHNRGTSDFHANNT